MKTIHFFGECMMELKPTSDNMMAQSFAGDIYNAAVYLKRCFPKLTSSVITAIGQDSISDKMLAHFETEQISTECVFRHPDKTIGIYLIETDDTGERSFVYWRSDSAARDTMRFIPEAKLAQFVSGDVFFFSGIPLAIMHAEHRNAFWSMLENLKARGLTIVFDPNYRAALWQSQQFAIAEFDKALSLSDIALPGLEDFEVLYQFSSTNDVVRHCQHLGVNEVVVKNGPASVVTCSQGEIQAHIIEPVKNVVDTTSAGDAFNGVFLGARLSGYSISDAVRYAAKAAGAVIQFPGAIAPKNEFLKAIA
ncbi:sugar kinase [Alteromonas ponticola]|uniref:Sugar kinase n=1 Tax=Alteromonas ponticola TaxID=2720613 RepID=A0ABX1R1D5_9ALTE|nr:sugar kinase [Alteromonas ponticola]NMH60275.1 sugar kinase [Alteromonas ponticola]